MPSIKIAIKLSAIPNQFFFDNFSLKTITETIVASVNMLRLLIGNKADGSSILLLSALIINV